MSPSIGRFAIVVGQAEPNCWHFDSIRLKNRRHNRHSRYGIPVSEWVANFDVANNAPTWLRSMFVRRGFTAVKQTNKSNKMSSSPTPARNPSAKPGTRPVGFRAQSSRMAEGSPGEFKHGVASNKPNSQPPASVATNARNAPPMKKRAKGSGFVGFLFLVGFGAFGYFIWVSLLQYEAYGVIQGRLISVSAPWDGTVDSWLVRDGDEVQQGQVIAEITNLEMEHELASYTDELKMSQALLDAEISKVKFSVRDQSERSQKAVAEYLEAYGKLLSEKSKLKELEGRFDRNKKLANSQNISRSEFESVFYQLDGQKQKIEKLEDAVQVLKARSEEASHNHNDGSSQLKPILAQIELAQSKIARLRQRIDQGKIRAPVSGRISKRHCLTGESAKSGDAIIEILEDNSVEAVLYLPQRIVDEFDVGNEMEITLEPNREPLRCTIVRMGNQFEKAPESIKGYYYENQPLLPVFLKPGPEAGPLMETRVGGTVKRPYEYRKGLAKLTNEVTSAIQKWQQGESSAGIDTGLRDSEAFVNEVTPTKIPVVPVESEAAIDTPMDAATFDKYFDDLKTTL